MEEQSMTTIEALKIVISKAREHHWKLCKEALANCVDSQMMLAEYDRAINKVEDYWDKLPD